MSNTTDPANLPLPFPIKPSPVTDNGAAPELPPQMQSVRSHTADEIVEMMNKTPLFMTSLDNVHDGPFDPSPRDSKASSKVPG